MTNPYDPSRFDEDGLPRYAGGSADGQSQPFSQQPYGQQPYGQQQPFANPQQPYGQQPIHGQVPYQGGPVQSYGGYQQMPYAAPKSWVVAAILAFFLGSFGAHNFYLGYKNRGITQLALYCGGLVTSFLLIGLPVVFAVAIWAFVEFILILVRGGKYATDANGLRLD